MFVIVVIVVTAAAGVQPRPIGQIAVAEVFATSSSGVLFAQ